MTPAAPTTRVHEPSVGYSYQTPSELVRTPIPPQADAGISFGIVAWGVGAVVLAALAVVVLRRRRSDPMERAFVRLTRSNGIDARGCAVLRRVARAGGATHPAVLVLTPSALSRAIKKGERERTLKPRDVRTAVAIAARLDWTRAHKRASLVRSFEIGLAAQSRGAGDGAARGSSPRSLSATSA